MNKMLLVSQVAGLAKIIEKSADDTEASLFEVPE